MVSRTPVFLLSYSPTQISYSSFSSYLLYAGIPSYSFYLGRKSRKSMTVPESSRKMRVGLTMDVWGGGVMEAPVPVFILSDLRGKTGNL